jgi:hypothetical protein
LHARAELAHLGLHGLKLRAHELRLDLRSFLRVPGLDLRSFLRVPGPNKSFGHVQGSVDVLLRGGKGPLGYVPSGVSGPPGCSQEGVQRPAGLFETLLGALAHLRRNLEAGLSCIGHDRSPFGCFSGRSRLG